MYVGTNFRSIPLQLIFYNIVFIFAFKLKCFAEEIDAFALLFFNMRTKFQQACINYYQTRKSEVRLRVQNAGIKIRFYITLTGKFISETCTRTRRHKNRLLGNIFPCTLSQRLRSEISV